MKTIKLNIHNPDPSVILEAAQIIESGGVVVHPTDTAYGLAASAFDTSAIQKIFQIKGRDFNKPLIVATRDLIQAKSLVEFNSPAEVLFQTFFPGPLTLVLPKKPLVPDLVTGGQPLGIRIPNCEVTLNLSKSCKVPYTTTSANPSGKPAPYSIDEILNSFDKDSLDQISLILDCGPLPQILPSTVVDLTNLDPKILRIGPISEEQIIEALKN